MSKNISQEIQQLEKVTLKLLLQDKTTKKNIIWATDNYSTKGYSEKDEITVDAVLEEGLIQSRASKAKEEQLSRQRYNCSSFALDALD